MAFVYRTAVISEKLFTFISVTLGYIYQLGLWNDNFLLYLVSEKQGD